MHAQRQYRSLEGTSSRHLFSLVSRSKRQMRKRPAARRLYNCIGRVRVHARHNNVFSTQSQRLGRGFVRNTNVRQCVKCTNLNERDGSVRAERCEHHANRTRGSRYNLVLEALKQQQ
jgi:hypothetical protein